MKLPLRYDAEERLVLDADGRSVCDFYEATCNGFAGDDDARLFVAAVNSHEAGQKALATCGVIADWWANGEMQEHYGAPAWMFMVREALDLAGK